MLLEAEERFSARLAAGEVLPTSLAEEGAPPEPARLAFTGSGAEYFRIWAANLLLSLLSLGVYSAWAKVRRARWFCQNTRLLGHVFDYHGRPLAILRGRIVALALFALYSFGFQFSRGAALAAALVLLAAGPWLLLSALRFRLANTSWCGLRFSFAGTVGEAYRVALPPLLLWLAPALAAVLGHPGLAGLAGMLLGITWPWLHHRLKAWQHRSTRYGALPFAFEPAIGKFYGAYIAAGAIGLAGLVPTGIAMFAATEAKGSPIAIWAAAYAAMAWSYLVVWPFLAARLQEAIWNRTSAPGVQLHTDVKARRLIRLALRVGTLTVLTLGLYWPYAAVALARYRLECLQIQPGTRVDALLAGAAQPERSASGEGAADLFGLDFGL